MQTKHFHLASCMHAREAEQDDDLVNRDMEEAKEASATESSDPYTHMYIYMLCIYFKLQL